MANEPSTRSHELRVATTWDGRLLPDEAVAHVSLSLGPDALRVDVDAPFHRDPPPSGDPGPVWKLWEHEVVEVFIAGPGERYTEIEIGPWGHHLVLRLEGRRHIVERMIALDLSVDRGAQRWRARASLGVEHLPPGPFTVNAYRIHGEAPERRYLAAFPSQGESPDFHRLEAFRPWPA